MNDEVGSMLEEMVLARFRVVSRSFGGSEEIIQKLSHNIRFSLR